MAIAKDILVFINTGPDKRWNHIQPILLPGWHGDIIM